jgi:Zn-dependent protease with chaperone function
MFRVTRPSLAGDEVYRDPQERDRAIRYSRTKEWLVLVDLVFGSVLGILELSTGVSARLRNRAERIAPKKLGAAMPFGAMWLALSFLVSLPLSYLGGYTVEHRYRLSNQSRGAWLLDQLKGMAVSLVVALPLIQGAYWVIRRYPQRWWAILSGLTIPFAVIFVNLAPVLLLPLFNKFEPLEDQDLADRVRTLAAGEGVHVSDVLQMDMSKQTKKANAFFTGIGNTKRIVMGDTLLGEFDSDEIEVVLAHELGHQVHRDIWKMIGMQAPVTLLTFYAANRLSGPVERRFGEAWGLRVEEGAADVAALPLLAFLGGLASLALSPLVNAINRNWIEHRADVYALNLTGKQGPFVSAMKKLGRMNLADPEPSPLVKIMLYSHPPLAERIAFGKSWKKGSV